MPVQISSIFNRRKIMFALCFLFFNSLSFSLAASNIVLIVVDDLDLVLDGMKPLNNTVTLVGERGATFSNCIVATPVCCPNRASILTGRYQHNHLTINNSISGGCNSPQWQSVQEPNTFAARLKTEMEYTTFYAGKYLNQYGDKKAGGAAHVPVGWDWWAGLIGNSKYYNYSLSVNGTEKEYGDEPEEYLTDVISELAVKFLNERTTDNPFLMVVAPPAPHSPFTPAERHKDKYINVQAKRTPNFNTSTQKDKHWLVRREPSPLPDRVLPLLDEVYRHRWETLLAVDELVLNIYQTLSAKNLLTDTYIIFTSDNGYHIGQFSMPIDKRQPYETDIRVPLLISGPGIKPSNISAPVSSVDLFATVLDIAGLEHPSDGTSLLKSTLALDRTLLIEYRGTSAEGDPPSGCPTDYDPNISLCMQDMACKCQDAVNNTFTCIRRISTNFNNIFCIFEDDEQFVEAYDLEEDNWQMVNVGYSMTRNHRHRFRNRLKKMSVCANSDCIHTGTESQAGPLCCSDFMLESPGTFDTQYATSDIAHVFSKTSRTQTVNVIFITITQTTIIYTMYN